MDINAVVDFILEADETELELVFEAASIRQQQNKANKVAQNFAELTPGTRVEICGNIRPKYLLGITGVVTGVMTKRTGDIEIHVDNFWTGHAVRFINRATGNLAVPANCLRKIAGQS